MIGRITDVLALLLEQLKAIPTPWRPALGALGAAGLVILAMFGTEVAAAVRTWDASTAYNHCWLVLPIAGWLAWGRRDRLAGATPEPDWRYALLALPLAFGWLVAERLGIMEGRQLMLVGMVWVLAITGLGPALAWAMAAPLLYLVFLVPFGGFLVPALQQLTVLLIEIGLTLVGITHYIDDVTIEIPEGQFLVAEACAGLRFLISAMAFGALYAIVMFRSFWRRLVVLAISVVVPLLANGLRAFGLVVLGHFQGSASAVAADHVLYGWLFSSIVILLMIAAGLPFREDGGAPVFRPLRIPLLPPGRPRSLPQASAWAVAAFVAVVTSGPAIAGLLDQVGAGQPQAVTPAFAPPAGCTADAAMPGRFRCGQAVLTVRLLSFPPRANWATIAAERRRSYGELSDEDVVFQVTPADRSAAWQGRQQHEHAKVVAVGTWLAGRAVGDGLTSRASQAWNALRGGGQGGGPVLAAVALEYGQAGAGGQALRNTLRKLLEEQSAALVAQAMALSRPR